MADLWGVLEPCGCGGRPLGGLDRVAGTVAALRSESTPSALLAVGDLLYEPDAREPLEAQEDLEAQAMAALVGGLRPDALVPGPTDLRLGGALLTPLSHAAGASLLVARGSPEEGFERTKAQTALTIGNRSVGVLVGGSASGQDAMSAAVAELRRRGAQVVVRVDPAHRVEQLAARIFEGDADVVIAAGADREGSSVERGSLVVFPGSRGEALWVIDLSFREGIGPFASGEARRIELGAKAPSDPTAREILDQSFARIRTLNARRIHAPTDEPVRIDPTQRKYAGARTCAACHTSAYLWWKNTPHGRAFATLQARGRELDLDCIGCHVTGFEAAGGARIGHLEELTAVGCESCHGPSSSHADNPSVPNSAQREVPRATCTTCHDPEHSPSFDYTSARAALINDAHGSPARSGSGR